jgi:predicted RNA-binding Zn-ribbon protein involved in translation (DUF1610 family)
VLIWGFRTRVAILAMMTYICDRCGVSAAHRVACRRRWFTLFFMAVFPISATKYTDTCINCGRVLELTKEQVDSVVPAVPAAGV